MLEDKSRDTCVSFDLELLSSFQEFQHIMLPCSLELRERDRPAVHALISCRVDRKYEQAKRFTEHKQMGVGSILFSNLGYFQPPCSGVLAIPLLVQEQWV